jgi:hypothetical protein
MSKNKLAGNFFRVLAVVLVVGTLAGCMKTGTGSQNNNKVSFVTLMHMAPFASSTEVYFNGDKKTSAIAAGTFSTSYGQVPPGSYEVKFKVAGSDSVLSTIAADTYDSLGFYTLVLFNRADSSIGSMKIDDDFSSLSLSNANYRFFNFCPDAPNVDLFLNSTKVQPGRHTADNEYGSYYNAFQTMAAGGYSVTVKNAGTDSVIASLPSVTLQAGAAYTIFLAGKKGSSTNPISVNVLQAAY